jgi:NAD(P)-dependent dehydrogenase (short-subunit alcohol dehydrogenase family)
MLDGKRVLITGAARGMGREIALEAARQGAASGGITDVDAKGLAETEKLLREAGLETVTAVTADLRSAERIRTAVDAVAERAGGLDSLFNNAGVLDHAFTPTAQATVETLSEEAWDAVYDINVKAVWLATKFAAPYLRASDRGPSIVNAASVSGLTGYEMPAYSSSKGAVIQLTRTTAVNLAPHIRANCYCPGSIKTDMSDSHLAAAADPHATARKMFGTHLIPRRGHVSEVAKLACFLASDDASFINGAVIPVDGGTMAWRGVREHVEPD